MMSGRGKTEDSDEMKDERRNSAELLFVVWHASQGSEYKCRQVSLHHHHHKKAWQDAASEREKEREKEGHPKVLSRCGDTDPSRTPSPASSPRLIIDSMARLALLRGNFKSK